MKRIETASITSLPVVNRGLNTSGKSQRADPVGFGDEIFLRPVAVIKSGGLNGFSGIEHQEKGTVIDLYA